MVLQTSNQVYVCRNCTLVLCKFERVATYVCYTIGLAHSNIGQVGSVKDIDHPAIVSGAD